MKRLSLLTLRKSYQVEPVSELRDLLNRCTKLLNLKQASDGIA